MPQNILVIGDAHAKPGVSNRRFEWLGRYIADTKPDVVIDIGDSYDMESLSAYDKGKASFEGRRYKADIEAGQDAFDRVAHYAGKSIRQSKLRRIKLYGNHEHRIIRATEDNAEFQGLLRIDDTLPQGWEGKDFLHPVCIGGVSFSHYFTSGRMGLAISGEYQAGALIKKQHVSCVMGHSHIFDYAIRTRADGKRIIGVVAGCFLDPRQYEPYAGPANKMWWRGLTLLKGVEDGAFEIEQIGVKRLERVYGKR